MSEEVLERLVQEVVALRRRVAHLETLENPGLPTNINADTLDGQHGSYYRDILIGMIVPFSGSLGGANNHHPVDTATGEPDLSWHICNGETVNGHATPDLRDRFVVGAGGSYAAGSKGGAATHTHGYSDVPSHNHSAGTLATGVAGQHTHPTCRTGPSPQYFEPTGWGDGGNYDGPTIAPAGNHSHSITGSTGTTGVSSPSTDSASSLPPYVALVYVMKVA